MLAVFGVRPALLLKATVLKEVLIPGYTKADGTFVAPHMAKVHVNPDVDQAAVLKGAGSHTQRLALRRLQKKAGWSELSPDHQYAHVLRHATELQQRASEAAKQSRAKKKAVSTPSASPLAAPPKPEPAAHESLPPAVAKVAASNQAPPAVPLSEHEVAAIKAYMAQVEVPSGVAKLSASATNMGTRRRIAQLQKLAAAGDLDGITNFATSRTRKNCALVDDYRHDLLIAGHAGRESVLNAPPATAAPAAKPPTKEAPAASQPAKPAPAAPQPAKAATSLPEPPAITGANMQNTALLAAQRKVKALYQAAHSADPVAAVMAITTSRGNGYQNRADDYKFLLLSHLGAGVKPATAPKPAASKPAATKAPAPQTQPAKQPDAYTPSAANVAETKAAMVKARTAAAAHLDKLAAQPDIHKPKNKPGHNVSAFNVDNWELKKYAEKFGIDPAEFSEAIQGVVADYGNNVKFKCNWHSYEDGYKGLESQLVFNGDDGTEIRYLFVFSETQGKVMACLDLFKAGQKGKGSAKSVLRNTIGVMKQMGITKMELEANLDVGGYAWAKFGFEPLPSSWDHIRKNMLKISKDINMSDSAREKVTQILNDNNSRAIWVLSDLKDGEFAVGKELLLGTDWMGHLNLKSKLQYRRFLGYVAG